MLVLSIQTGLPSGLPPLLDLDDEQEEALAAAVRKVNKLRRRRPS